MTSTAQATGRRKAKGHLAGEPGVWVFVAGDFLLFGLFFLTYAYYRALDPLPYVQGAATQSLLLGIGNTLLLLTGSWCVASAVEACRHEAWRRAAALLGAGIVSGIGFTAVKIIEWSGKFANGITLLTNDYFMFYFMLTGIHLLHVLAGIGVLCLLHARVRHSVSATTPVDLRLVEAGGVFWHLIDLLWIILFALLYLLR